MKTLFFVLLLLIPGLLEAQQLSVKSFQKLDNDLSARGSEGHMDQNRDKCAIIKVVTNEKGFVFEPDALGLVGSVQKIGEIWLYVPYGARRLTIRHAQLGVLRNYAYPERIEKACVYELVLTTGRTETIVHETIGMDYLVIRTDPSDALVYIDDVYEAGTDGMVQKFLQWGSHNYRVEHPLYHTEAGRAEIGLDGKKELTVRLRPACGYVAVSSLPESGAEVYIDGERVGVTPYRSNRLKSGIHLIRVIKAMYQPLEREVRVHDADTSACVFDLLPNFGEMTFTTVPEAAIWLNNAYRGQGSWSGRLNAGTYLLEVRQEGHRSLQQTVTVSAGEKRTVTLGSPVPLYGMLTITSHPGDALVKLGGKEYGRTPVLLKDLLIGKYMLELSKAGYASVHKEVTVEEGKIESVDLRLSSGRLVSIQTDRPGDVLFVDGQRIGLSPQTLELSYGTHVIRADRERESMEQEIEVSEGEGEQSVELGFGLLGRVRWSSSVTSDQKRVLNQLIENMVKVEGGSFQMGGTSEQGRDAMDREKPIHTVTLSDYYICKYEVSQQEWEVVMGNNPSHFQGKDLPVEQVSWEDCQAFIQKLNTLTGLDFKLPTEAQWEYAARGGSKSQGNKYSGSNTLSEVGWFWENSGEEILGGEWEVKKVTKNNCCTHPVGQKRPNELGLYDMSGNVYEWCSDRYGKYRGKSQTDPIGPGSGSSRVYRSGGWGDAAGNGRVSRRGLRGPGFRYSDLGLRLVF